MTAATLDTGRASTARVGRPSAERRSLGGARNLDVDLRAVEPWRIPVGRIGAPRLIPRLDPTMSGWATHLAVHGPLPQLSLADLVAQCLRADLRGRGGAGFSFGAKLQSVPSGRAATVVVNAAEGEPASAKDQVLLAQAPQLVLDGAALTAAALSAGSIVVAVSQPLAAAAIERALSSRPDAGMFSVRTVADRFVSGEARALLSGLGGGSGLPPGRRVLPTERGLDDRPTLLSNAETFAQVAVLARIGFARFSAGETTLVSVSGAVASPGVLEIPIGTGLADLADAVGAGPSQALVIGGFHGNWLPNDPTLVLSRAGLAAAGGTLGAGAIMFVGSDSCGLAELARVSRWLADESAKQCGPCAFGLPALADDVDSIARGSRSSAAAAQRHASLLVGRGACAHPDGAVRFVRSGLAALADEVASHAAYGGCRRTDRGHLSTSRRRAFAAAEGVLR